MVNLMVNEIKTIALHPAAKSADFIKQLIAQYVPDFRLNVILGQQDFEYIQLPDFKILIDVGSFLEFQGNVFYRKEAVTRWNYSRQRGK